MTFSFHIHGVPAPQGSKTAVMRGGKPILIEGKGTTGRNRHKAWRTAVTLAAAQAIGDDDPMTGPLSVSIGFRLPMPESRPRRVRDAGIAPSTVKPDIDKLVRATLDGLVDGGLIAGDQLVCDLHATKMETTGNHGAIVTVSEVAS